MKWMKLLLSISFIIIFSCEKPDEEPQIIVSKSKVKKGEIVTAEVINQPASTQISWYISNYRELFRSSPDGKMAKVFFIRGNEKEFTFRAGLHHQGDSLPYAYVSKTIEVENDYFKFPGNLPEDEVQPTPADWLTLSPLLMDDGSLSFSLTCAPYVSCFKSYIVTRDVNISNGNITATINQVWAPGQCVQAKSVAMGEIFTKHVYQDGTYSLQINCYNKIYRVTMIVSNNATRYAFYRSSPFLNFNSEGSHEFSFTYLNGGSDPAYTLNKF